MTSNKQVSSVIRISQEERDASARATHLEAATRKFLVTTNERKQMSTKTNFKRIALVAVAALGMGVLSSVPAKATYIVAPTLTLTTGTATKAKSDSTTAASITVTATSDIATTDTLSVTATAATFPGTRVPGLVLYFSDTTGSTNAVTVPSGKTGGGGGAVSIPATATDSIPASAISGAVITSPASAGVIKMKLLAQLDTSVARLAGTYTFTVAVTPFSATNSGIKGTPVTGTLTITVAALDSESETASAGSSTALLSSSGTTAPSVDASINAVATASTTIRGYVYVNLVNTGSAQANESVTLTTTVGSIGEHGGTAPVGKNVTLKYNTGGAFYPIFSDGTAGTAVVTVKSTSVTFANKTVNFYASQPSSIVARALNTSPGVGTTSSAVEVVAKDANGLIWSGSLALYSDTVGIISDTATADGRPANCTYTALVSAHLCSVTGVVAGTAKVKAYTSAQTVVSNEVSLTVTSATAATVKLAWDKASYAPGEKAILSVTVLDSTGKAVPTNTFGNLFATGGISLSSAAGNGSDTLTAISVITTSPAADYVGTSTDPQKRYTVYMPTSGATVKASATGGSSLPLAGQVAVSASATVTDNAAAALAAVTALATTVASLKTLITTLTNLVLKIQKKVKA